MIAVTDFKEPAVPQNIIGLLISGPPYDVRASATQRDLSSVRPPLINGRCSAATTDRGSHDRDKEWLFLPRRAYYGGVLN